MDIIGGVLAVIFFLTLGYALYRIAKILDDYTSGK